MQDYLEKARKAEEAGLKSTNAELKEGWLQVAKSYRLLANRNAQLSRSKRAAGAHGKYPASSGKITSHRQ